MFSLARGPVKITGGGVVVGAIAIVPTAVDLAVITFINFV